MPKTLVLTALCAAMLAACATHPKSPTIPEGSIVKLALLETSDLHQNVLSFDYYGQKPDPSLGLERTATLINAAHAENPNNVLLDDGDAIQGTLLGDYQALAAPIKCQDTLAIYKVMNALHYDGAGLGNHEFNYGLGFLSQITNTDFQIAGIAAPEHCGAPNFPLVLSNVVNATTQKPIFKPFTFIPKSFTASKPDGTSFKVQLNIGIIGFVPPQIMEWDQKKLAGRVAVNGVVESAQRYLPQMRAGGADLIVALSHGGLDAAPYSPTMENASLYLSKTGIDALLLGHSHLIFPLPKETPSNRAKLATIDPSLANLPGVDFVNGLVNGVPAVMPQSWGRRLGIIQLVLKYQGGKWAVQKELTKVEARGFKYQDGITTVAADPTMAALIEAEHRAASAYANQALGSSTDFEMSTYFALVGDVSAIQIVNQAQIDYVNNVIATSSDSVMASYKSIPVISCSAPFRAGRNGPTDFTDTAKGASPAHPYHLQVRNPGDLYLYGNNDLHAVKISGADLKNWLEKSAQQFAQINPALSTDQDLVPSYSTIYNFDVCYASDNALRYQIDVTRPIGSRIVELSYAAHPISERDTFIVATNDYRAAGGGNFPGIDGSKTIFKAPDANQTVLSNYLRRHDQLTAAKNGIGQSWSFVATATKGPIILRSAPNKFALAQARGLQRVLAEGALDSDGFAKYRIDLSK